MAKALRVFYRKSDNQIVWTHELRGTGEFPNAIEDNLAEIPNKMPDGITPLGGLPEDYACIEETDPQKASDFLASDDNEVVDGSLVIGSPRVIPVMYRYEVFSKEITHPKLATTKYLDYEVLEFNEELTIAEISNLEIELGKIVRRLL